MTHSESPSLLGGVAIIGMAGRFPGAQSVDQFWRNQLNGVESISHFNVEELEVPRARELSERPTYVRARSILADVDLFDAEFFGIHPREAELMDRPMTLSPIRVPLGCMRDAAFPPIFCRDSAPTLNSFRASRAAIKLAIIWRCWATVWIFSPPAFPTN